ncbi:DUF4364 family protein [Helicovermis profundi]|uniref:DUF4364 family protein n=1 Tax=Helicovermis profundi TaxID=3065157 RepID=A0AAU9E4R7_9FIRM|nr:DUF4364 family protein [Clostridia bacterium S502]
MFTNNSDKQVKNKLVILYILNRFDKKITNRDFTEFFLENELFNYFELQLTFDEMLENNLLNAFQTGNETYYKITNSGIKTLSLFNDKISKRIRNKLDKLLDFKISSIKKTSESNASYKKIGDTDYEVNIIIKEFERTLLKLDINVVSEEQAKIVCENFKNNTSLIYSKTINLLLGE